MELKESHSDELLQEIKKRLVIVQEHATIGVPLNKIRSHTNEIKRKLLMRWIREQRDKNCSYQQIEDMLNSENVPTLSGKTRWDKGFICQIEKGK